MKGLQNGFKRLTIQQNFWLLILWIIIGTVVRFTQLTRKTLWTDEFATMVFSLGNTYHSVPLNQVISVDTLLQPLRLNSSTKIADVISLLLQEDNHPPLYFILAHLWLKLLSISGEYISVWEVRSLPALFGVLSIPSIYLLGKFAFRSDLVGLFSAAMMAVSPYAVFLAQEARHYTLAMLLVIASLGCFIVAARCLWYYILLPSWLIIFWIIINCLGLSIHYFFSITIASEIITLFLLFYYQIKQKLKIKLINWIRLSLVYLGTFTTILIWFLMIIPRDYGNGMTDWIRQNPQNILSLISPIFQLLAAWITMISLLPIESSFLPVIMISGLIMLIFFIKVTPGLIQGIKNTMKQQPLETGILLSFIVSTIFIFFGITYFGGMDITRGARYSFVYFPAVMVLVGLSLADNWNSYKPFISNLRMRSQRIKSNYFTKKMMVIIVLLMGFLSAITVCFNLGYQKYYEPDRLLKIIQKNSFNQILITTTHQSLVQTGEMMGIAWEIQQHSFPLQTNFLLISQPDTFSLQKSIDELPKPLDVWTVNFKSPVNLEKCTQDHQKFPLIEGYSYQRYQCL